MLKGGAGVLRSLTGDAVWQLWSHPHPTLVFGGESCNKGWCRGTLWHFAGDVGSRAR